MTCSRKVLPYLPLILAITMALMASGCMWGIVTDVETGAPVSNAEVTYTDANGDTGTTTTDAHGMYVFDQAAGPYPARGPATLTVDAEGYEQVTVTRVINYGANPNATLADPSSFWEVRSFKIVPLPVADLAVVDLFANPARLMFGREVLAKIQNFGPDGLEDVSVQLSCEMVEDSDSRPRRTETTLDLDLASGESVGFPTGIIAHIDETGYDITYVFECTVHTDAVMDPDTSNNTYSETFE